MSAHMDLLKEWWEDTEVASEDNPVRPGDVIIAKFGEDDFRIVNDSDRLTGNTSFEYRILERAELPYWFNSVAVIAHTDDGHVRQVWERDGDTDYWVGTEGYIVRYPSLKDVTALVEARITEEKVEKAAITLYGQKTSPEFGTFEYRWSIATPEQKSDHRKLARAILESSL